MKNIKIFVWKFSFFGSKILNIFELAYFRNVLFYRRYYDVIIIRLKWYTDWAVRVYLIRKILWNSKNVRIQSEYRWLRYGLYYLLVSK